MAEATKRIVSQVCNPSGFASNRCRFMRIIILVFLTAMALLNACSVFRTKSIFDGVIMPDLNDIYYVRSYWGDHQFCRSMLKDIKSNNYTIIEPIVRAGDYKDISLKAYIDKCPDLYLNKRVTLESRIQGYDYIKELPEKEQAESGWTTRQTKDFRIYYVDLDNDPENGKEYIFYGAGEQRYLGVALEEDPDVIEYVLGMKIGDLEDSVVSARFTGNASFKVVDFSACKKGDTYTVIAEHDENSSDGIIKYNSKHYIYGFNNIKHENAFYLEVAELQAEKNKSFSSICLFKLDNPLGGGIK